MPAPPPRPDPRRIPDVPDRADLPETIEDLTLRIEMAELRVVRRDLEFQLHWDALHKRGKAVLVPSRWLLPALGTGASWLFWRLIRGRRPGRGHHDRHAGRGRHAFHGAAPAAGDGQGPAHGENAARPEFGTLQLLTMLWGLMPLSIRGKLGPEVSQLLLGVIAGFMHGRKQKREASREDDPAAPR
ncbi:hypothetical protein [Mitsuaria sp. GD03876]|uniref:hypothetical protein n=1 Tax=Mitsuaria sp. GD03876 TaxID=2975399 RepID=UPI00244B7536|nr:hypothetical protein [Mitsuaria sp. GD03876]MDH0866084.1 hypothetical protein [Mitsuaria sp. GD03876]